LVERLICKLVVSLRHVPKEREPSKASPIPFDDFVTPTPPAKGVMNTKSVHTTTPEPDRQVVNTDTGWVAKEVIAQHLGIGMRTVNTWMKRRILPYAKIGRVVRFNIADCDAAMKKFQVNGGKAL
jgi:excisionase family DNA binding protein